MYKMSFSKILIGTSMIFLLGTFSAKIASANCDQYHDDQVSCNQQPNCKFLPSGTNCRAPLNTQNTYSNFICAMTDTQPTCANNPEGCDWGNHASFCLPFIGKEK